MIILFFHGLLRDSDQVYAIRDALTLMPPELTAEMSFSFDEKPLVSYSGYPMALVIIDSCFDLSQDQWKSLVKACVSQVDVRLHMPSKHSFFPQNSNGEITEITNINQALVQTSV